MAKRLSPYEQMKANGEKILRLSGKKGMTKSQREEQELVEGLTRTLEESAYGSDLKDMVHEAEAPGRPSNPPDDQPASRPAARKIDQPTDRPISRATAQAPAQPVYRPHYQPLGLPTYRADAGAMSGGGFNPAGPGPDNAPARYAYLGLSASQRAVLHYLMENWQPIISYPQMEQDLDIRYDTIRNAVKRLKKLGFLSHRQARMGQIQGVHFVLNQAMLQTALPEGEEHYQPQSRPVDLPTYQPTNQAPGPPAHRPTSPSGLLDRQKENNLSVKKGSKGDEQRLLALADEDVAFFWPALAKAGFGSDQVRQILARLEQVGKTGDRIFASLDHADWELASGGMRDKDGGRVQNPLGYLFNSLARTGYYRRPQGYVSPDEQEALDREQEARQVREATARAEEQAYLAWRESLGKEELAAALKGCIGPKEQWLKAHWRKEQGREEG